MDRTLLYLAGVLTLGILAQWASWRLRLPAILTLLVVGFAAGLVADVEDYVSSNLLFPFVSLSVAIILFEGGLSLKFRELRQTARAVVHLVTIGVLLTWVLTAVAAYYLLRFPASMAILVGALLVVSGPTVIVPLLEHVQPKRRIGSVVKWEGIVNDPIGAVLAVLVFETVFIAHEQRPAAEILAGMVQTALVGTALGVSTAVILIQLLRRHLVPDFLQSSVFLAAVIASFTASNMVASESGLVTVTILGVILANQHTVSIHHIVEFKENLRVILLSILFILLASRLNWQNVADVGFGGVAFFIALLLLVRPLAVWISTIGTDLNTSEKIFLSWMAPRGIVAAAVSSLFALELIEHAAPDADQAILVAADQLVPVTFVVIVGTVLVYGLTAAPLARKLNLADPDPQGILFAGADPLVRDIAKALQAENIPVLLVDTNRWRISAARLAGIPTVGASILSEFVREEADLGGIGRLLAMTPNDEVNALAALELQSRFSRSQLYQLQPAAADTDRVDAVSAHLRARLLFDARATYGWLTRRHADGAVIKRTQISDEFTLDDYRAMYGDDGLILFILDDSGKLEVATVDNPPEPNPGDTIISMVKQPPAANATDASAAKQSTPPPKPAAD